MFQVPDFISRLLIASVLSSAVLSGTALAQPEYVKELIEERLDRGDLPHHLRPIAKKILDDLPNAQVPLFNVDWEAAELPPVFDPSDSGIFLASGTSDIEGNIILFGGIGAGANVGNFVIKYSSEGVLVWVKFISGFSSTVYKRIITSDLDGNVYVGHNGANWLIKLSSNGTELWRNTFASDTASGAILVNVLADADGNTYILGDRISKNSRELVINCFRPDGILLWIKSFVIGESGTSRLKDSFIDQLGNIRLLSNGGVFGGSTISSIDPAGQLRWSTFITNVNPLDFGNQLAFDSEDNTYSITGNITGQTIVKVDTDGNIKYTTYIPGVLADQGGVETGPNSIYPQHRIIVDRDGMVHTTYRAGRPQIGDQKDLLFSLAQIDPDGGHVASSWAAYNHFQNKSGGDIARVMDLSIDRFGNPYILVNYSTAPSVGTSVILKYDKHNIESPFWSHSMVSSVAGSGMFLFDQFIDFGDNIYYTGRDDNGARFRLGKISQQFTAVPVISKSSPNLQIHNQSLWGEFVGGVSSYTEFFQINHAQTQFNIGIDETFSIFLLGDFGGTVDFDGSMALGMGFEATASGGAVNVDYPGNLEIIVPGSDKLSAGQVFTITAQFDAHSSGNIVSDATPELSAGLKANVALNISSGAELIAFSDTIATIPLVNANPTWEGLVPGLSMNVPTGNPGSWIEFGDERNIVTGRLTRPLFSSNGGVNLSTGIIRSDLKPEVFFSLRGNLTNYISTYQLGVPTIYSINSGSTSAWALGASVNFAQAFAEIKLEANQNLTFEPTMSTVYEFNPAVNIHLPGQVLTGQTTYELPMTLDGSTWTGSFDISVLAGDLSGTNNSVTITPKSKITSTLHNRTWVDIQPSVGWETLAAEAHASAFGENLFGFEFCVLCFNFPLTDDLPINLFDSTFNMPVTEVELDPIIFLVDPNNNPRISGTSRARLSAFIYDQVSADPFELAAFINSPAKKMLIYGDKFLSTLGEPLLDHVVLCSQGRVVELPTTILNSRTALIEIPNSMRLVPGIARIWAVSTIPGEQGSSISESIDFPIELPIPNLGTAGPNLWAADPRLSNLAIDVIDGLTPSRTASFIARRDYWYVLADMWDAIDAGNGTGLFASYPIYDFTAEPPMPSVLIAITDGPSLPDASHSWSFEGNYLDSAGSANGTPSGFNIGFTTDGVPPLLGEALDIGFGEILLDQSSLAPMGEGDYSVAFWMKMKDTGPQFRTIFDSILVGQGGMQIGVSSGAGYLRLDGGPSGVNASFVNGGDFPPVGDWHHYALTIDRDSASGVIWYVDGQAISVEDATGAQWHVPHSDSVRMGQSNPNGGNALAAELDDFTIFNRAITPAEVSHLAHLAESMPIGRFKQPVENGILYSLMPKSEYDEPKLVSISLDVAGPGGGKSNSIDLTVAAPSPVISNVIPRRIVPDAGQFTMTVEGPLSVPFFNGFQEERFGNFNKSSIVLWDGIPLATTYITPGTLSAVVTADLTMQSGNALISVYTPSNGTGYFDSFSGGIIESGGDSNAIALAVRYPNPIITAMAPEVTSRAVIDRCPDNPGQVRLRITGEDFWPGATIWIDGVEFETFVQDTKDRNVTMRGISDVDLSYNVIYTYLDVFDLSRVYSAPVMVLNPDGYQSDIVYLDIVDEAAYEAYYNVKLPPQMMPGECK